MTQRRYFAGPDQGFPANGKGFLFAPVVWFAWFVALYSVQGAGCEVGLHEVGVMNMSVLRLALGALTVIAAAAIAIVGFWSFSAWGRLRENGDDAGDAPRQQSQFMSYAALLHAALFFVAVIWSGIPIVMTDLCNP